MARRACLLALLAASLVAGASAAGGFNFFPPQAANATPTAWARANQTAYPQLGNAADAGLLTVAIRDYYPAEPAFFFVPGAWCDTAGVNVSLDAVAASLPPPPATRRMRRHMMAEGGRALLVAAPAAPTQVAITDACDLQQVTYSVGAGDSEHALQPYDAVAGVYRVGLGTNLGDGSACVIIRATYATGPSQFATSPDYRTLLPNTTANPQLASSTVFRKTVCLFKYTRQASAVLTFDMCTNNQFTLNVSGAAPLPVNVSLDGSDVGNLLRPLIKVWGAKTNELDGTPVSESYDQLASHSQSTWISKYIPLPSSYAGELLSFPLSDQLQEGTYNVSASVSLITAFPSLVDLTGLNQITQDDESGISSGVTGLYEADTYQIYDGVLVGVQKASTPTVLSAISAVKPAANKAIVAGDEIILSWQFVGIGSATCTHDSTAVSNAPGNKCTSPLSVTAKAGAASTKHNVTVVFTDACGRSRTAQFQYTLAGGVTALTPTEIIGADGTIVISTTTATPATARKGAAGAARTPGGLALLGGALLAGLLALAV